MVNFQNLYELGLEEYTDVQYVTAVQLDAYGDAEMPSISVGFKNYKLRGVLGYEFQSNSLQARRIACVTSLAKSFCKLCEDQANLQ